MKFSDNLKVDVFKDIAVRSVKVLMKEISDYKQTQSAFTFSQLTIETLEQGVKDVQS